MCLLPWFPSLIHACILNMISRNLRNLKSTQPWRGELAPGSRLELKILQIYRYDTLGVLQHITIREITGSTISRREKYKPSR